MTLKTFIQPLLVCILSLSTLSAQPLKPLMKVEKLLKSKGGYIALYLVEDTPTEFPKSQLVISKGEKLVTVITDAKPVSFSPVEDILLLKEIGGDDDLQFYLLNLAGGEVKKEQSRIDYVFGGRWASDGKWSKDGATILLRLHMTEPGQANEARFSVKELISNNQKPSLPTPEKDAGDTE